MDGLPWRWQALHGPEMRFWAENKSLPSIRTFVDKKETPMFVKKSLMIPIVLN
jgi:hypothetical protein